MSKFPSETFECFGKRHTIFGLHRGDHSMRTYRSKQTFYEILHLTHLRSLKLEGTYVDVGANIGQHMIFYSEHCPSTMIVGFEPVPEVFSVLEYNAARMSTPARVMQQAVWKTDGLVAMSDFDPSSPWIGRSMVTGGLGMVESVTLDTYFKSWEKDRIVFIKIDVEGKEPEVIQGAKNTIKKYQPILMVEEGYSVDRRRRLKEHMDEINYVYVEKIGGASCPTHFWGPRA